MRLPVCHTGTICGIPVHKRQTKHPSETVQAGNIDAEGARPLPVPAGKPPKMMDDSAEEPVMGIPDSPGAVPYSQYRNLRLLNMRGMLSAGGASASADCPV